jgi:hypothetical protein
MQEFFGFRSFRQFERTRREIKLPYDLLNDIRFRQLPDARKAHLICLLLLSARMNNFLPNSPIKLEQFDWGDRTSRSERVRGLRRLRCRRKAELAGPLCKPAGAGQRACGSAGA